MSDDQFVDDPNDREQKMNVVSALEPTSVLLSLIALVAIAARPGTLEH